MSITLIEWWTNSSVSGRGINTPGEMLYFEPLKTIIDLTTDKRETLMFFLSQKQKILLEDYELI